MKQIAVTIIVPTISHALFFAIMYYCSRLMKKWYSTIILSAVLNCIIYYYTCFVSNVYNYGIDRVVALFYGLLMIYISLFLFYLRRSNKSEKYLNNPTSIFTTFAIFVFGYLTIIAFPYYLSLTKNPQQNSDIIDNILLLIRPFHFSINAMTSGQFEVEGTVAHKIIIYFSEYGGFYFPLIIITSIIVILAPFSAAVWLLSMINTRFILTIMGLMKKKQLYFYDFSEFGISIAKNISEDDSFKKINFVFINLTNENITNDVLKTIDEIGGIYLPDPRSIEVDRQNTVFLLSSSDTKNIEKALASSILQHIDPNKIFIAIGNYSTKKSKLFDIKKINEQNIFNPIDDFINRYFAEINDGNTDYYILGEGIISDNILDVIRTTLYNRILIFVKDSQQHVDLNNREGERLFVKELPDVQDFDDKFLPTCKLTNRMVIIIASDDPRVNVLYKNFMLSYFRQDIFKEKHTVFIYCANEDIIIKEKQRDYEACIEKAYDFKNIIYFGQKEEFIDYALENDLKKRLINSFN